MESALAHKPRNVASCVAAFSLLCSISGALPALHAQAEVEANENLAMSSRAYLKTFEQEPLKLLKCSRMIRNAT